MTSDHVCPRCGGSIPNNDTPGKYVGALSRTDNRTEICSACGTDEALEDFTGITTPRDAWPVRRSTSPS